MAGNGFIKIHRCCRNNVLWKDKPFTKWQAFEDLLLSAAYEPHDVLIKGVIVHLERGQLIRGVHQMAADWGWSVNKTNGFIKLLATQKMGTSKGTPQGTLVTIENYEIYQTDGVSKGTAKGTAQGRAKVQHKVDEEEREEREEVKEYNIYRDLPDNLLESFTAFSDMRKKIKKPLTDKAAEMLLKKLNQLSSGDINRSIEILDQSTMNSWASVYPLNNQNRGKKDNRQALTDLIESGAFDE